MPFHIYQFSNLSPKSVLLTNPASPRDTHLLPGRGFMEPEYPPLINFLKASEITLDRYDLLLKKALNIYTGTHNWCFWDFGESTSDVGRKHAVGVRQVRQAPLSGRSPS